MNLTLSINASSFVDEQIEIEAKESSGFVTFNVYELIDDIAKSQGLSYAAYTDSANHPGLENTKNLMLELMRLIKQKKEDELAFIQDLHTKIEALPETATAEEYSKIHPWFLQKDGWTLQKMRQRSLEMTEFKALEEQMAILNLELTLIDNNRLDDFFSFSNDVISSYVIWRGQNGKRLRLPETDQKSINKDMKAGNYWDANLAESAASMLDFRIALLRLSARFISTSRLSDKTFLLNFYRNTFDELIFADELDEHPIHPDYLIGEFTKRVQKYEKEHTKSKINPEGFLPAEFQKNISIIIKKIKARAIAMPKPFGTRARLEAEEEARIKTAKKEFEEEKKATQRKKEEEKRVRNLLSKLSREAGKKAKKLQMAQEEDEKITDSIEPAADDSELIDIPSEAPAPVTSSSMDGYLVGKELAALNKAEVDSTTEVTAVTELFQKANFGKKAAASSREECSKEAHQELRWIKHATENLFYPSCKIILTSGQRDVLDAIRDRKYFSFTMDKFVNLMEGIGITEQSRKGSHAHFSTPGRLPKIFVNPHCGWTNRFGPGAMKGMLDLVNSLSLGEDSEYVD